MLKLKKVIIILIKVNTFFKILFWKERININGIENKDKKDISN